MRLDTLAPSGPFRDFIEDCGIAAVSDITRMRLNARPVETGDMRSYAMVGQAFG